MTNLGPWPKYSKGHTPVNKTSQEGCSIDEKRCSRCLTIQLKEGNYWKNKRAYDGLQAACMTCQRASRTYDNLNREPHYRKMKGLRGYLVVEGFGMLQNNSFLTWTEVHSKPTSLSFMDGTILKRIKTGELFEVWNNAFLHEMEE